MTTTKTRFSKKLSFKVLASTVGASLLIFGLSGCGHDNPIKKTSPSALKKAYFVGLNRDQRDCIDAIAAHSQQSPYRPSAPLDKKCKPHYPAIAKQMSKSLGQTVTVSDLNVPDFWMDFFKTLKG